MDLRHTAAVPAGEVSHDYTATTIARVQPSKKYFQRLIIGFLIVIAVAGVFTLSRIRADASDYVLPENSYLFGESISGLDLEDLYTHLDAIKREQLPIMLSDGTKDYLSLDDIGVLLNPQRTIVALLNEQTDIWQSNGGQLELLPVYRVDESKLSSLSQRSIVGHTKPINAQVTIENGIVGIAPATMGWGLTPDQVIKSLTEYRAGQNNEVVLQGQNMPPAVTTEHATIVGTAAQAFADAKIVVQFGDQSTTLKNAEHMRFTTYTESGVIDFGYDSEQLRQALSEVAAAASQAAWHELFEMKDGQRSIVRPGKQGTMYAGVDQAVEQLLDSGLAPGDRTVTLVKSAQAYQSLERSVANTWIDVDLTNHQMTLWENGAVHKVFPISGGKPETPTPLGEYRITSKTRKMTMSGPGYATPNVEYISWFKYNYAIHSAYWHDRFGEANVSLGCVNARTDEAKYVYEWAPIGTKVVTRY